MQRTTRTVVATMALAAAALPTAATAAERVARSERDLLVVADLTTHANQKFSWLYRFLEANAVSMAQRKLGRAYRKIYALAKENATLEKFQRGLAGMSEEPSVKAIDVFVNLHGGPQRLWFHEGAHQMADVAEALSQYEGYEGKLRLLYSTACYGATHAAAFLRGGFRVVSGSRRVNTNGAHDYPTVMEAWRDGKTFLQAQASGNSRFWINTWDGLARRNGFSDVDSYKDVFGAGGLRIDER